MKLKLLAAPVLIVLIIVMAIWVVYPAFQDMQSKNESLRSEQTKLAEIQDKNNKAGALLQTLNGETERSATLMSYIPQQKNEEDMISTLNSLADANGLSVYKIGITDAATPAAQVVPADTSTDAVGVGTSDTAAAPAAPVVNNFVVDLGVAGNYANIKTLLSQIAALQRFNSITSLKITKSKSAQNTDDSGVDNLQADISLNFNYMVKSDAVVNLNNAIFSSGNFDMAVIDNIKNTMSTVVNNLTVDAHGVPNPFVR